ncbi:hypothetical protein [Cupriavidus lacunae]|uniref:hypothetical protein n=1 Tax=Cupriavidus lacunae TaxID=2666307 RepID=UPI001FCA2B59|nr:hypothetical protein [Cupriavidus lacunae]
MKLVYVSRLSRLDETHKPLCELCTALYISQNVSLFCAASALATVARSLVDRRAGATDMRLKPAHCRH